MGLFGVAWGFLIIVFTITALIGAIVGACSGFLMALVMRLGYGDKWKDALLGGFGSLTGWFGAIFLPWQQWTVHRPIVGGGEMTETTSAFPHPFLAAWVVAALLPVLRGFWNFAKSKH